MGPFRQVEYTGTSEGAVPQSRIISSWYSADGFFIFSQYPWLRRGGIYKSGMEAGLFNFHMYVGSAVPDIGFRLVLAF